MTRIKSSIGLDSEKHKVYYDNVYFYKPYYHTFDIDKYICLYSEYMKDMTRIYRTITESMQDYQYGRGLI